MLKVFRQRKQLIKWVLWGIVLVVGFMMVITLVPGIGGGIDTGDPYATVAVVGREQISRQEVLRRLEQLQALQGQTNPFFRRLMAEQVIDDLVFLRAVEQEAARLGVEVTREELSAQIRKMPALYPEGKFVGTAEYQRILQQEFRMTVGEFEDEVRVGQLVNKLYRFLTDGLSVTDREVEQEFRARNEKVAVEYALFKPRALEAEIQPREEELQAYFKERQGRGRYELPERRRVRYVLVDFDWVAQRAPVTRGELEASYQRNLESYRVAEQVRLRHILFRFPDGATEEQREKVRAEARRVRAEVAQGKDFAALAKKHSADKTSAEKGGDAGWVMRGQVVPVLEAVLFSLKKGAASDPVEVDYGIHIVLVTDHQPARLKSFEEVRGEIEPVLAQQKNQLEALQLAQRIVEEVRGSQATGRAGKTLAAATQAVALQVAETPRFALTDSLAAFAGSTSFQEASFRLKPEEVSEPVSVPTGYAVLQLLEKLEPGKAKFADVRDQAERDFRQERAGERARQQAQALAAATQSKGSGAGDLRAAARAAHVEVKLAPAFTRTDSVPELGPAREFAAAVFTVPVGTVVGPVRVGVNWAVMRVAARQEADLKALAKERELIASQLLQTKRQITFQFFREGLKKRLSENGQLRMNQPAIDRILGRS